MACAALFGAASMLLAVLMALVPLTLASAGAGGPVPLAPAAAAAAVLNADGPPYAGRDDIRNRAENLGLNAEPATVAPPSQPLAVSPVRGTLTSRRGAPITGAGRTGGIIQSPSSVENWNARKQLRLAWPLRGVITSGYGWRTHPIFGTREFHTGIDIAGPSGAPIVAAYRGIVSFVGWKSGYGEIVIVDHGHGILTSYAHLSAATVSPGQAVEQGQEVGRTGSTGWSTGPHLFFEVYEGGVPRNPTGLLP
jgi:murein DD-endopeptidase MepM/ murein hydrolase activator NlpD